MKIAVLGATGSIGTQTLDVVRNCLGEEAKVVAMSAFSNMDAFGRLVQEFSPEVVWTPHDGTGEAGLAAMAAECSADVVVNALVGGAGLAPT
ncbi:MAG: 1-deoxy-D-xylulose-5-phosphate reductoisomerase, partial [Defluviitaleaceae bacterium]|nr:1-deoxy-D-xylulose-5-phosphate reductoisomerase [Defluviitaleaceae bacterium]